MTYHDEGPPPSEGHGFLIAVTYFGLVLLVAALFTLYLLLWDGGGNMS